MGSNSFRLVLYEYETDGSWRLADEIRRPVRVSEGLGDEGLLQPEPMGRAVAAAETFAAFLRDAGVDEIDAVATSAIRDAPNRDELLAEIRRRSGIEARVITGAEEAWYGYLAIVGSIDVTDGFGIDVGGGSVQVMRIADGGLREAESVRLGAVRMSEAFLPDDEARPKQMARLRAHVGRVLSEFEWWAATTGEPLVAIGGTVRNLAAAVRKREGAENGLPFSLARDALGRLIEELASRPAPERGDVPGIKPDRGDVILGGALVVAAAMEQGGFAEVEVSGAGLREGVLFERMRTESRIAS
jgi:exopolyphosphatase / guanosine-5'-triphosphate,3'-diphosphate pyrophosphatase